MNPGSIVRCRNRDWVLLPSERSDVFLLRPLAAASDEVVAIHKQLADLVGYDLPEERVRPSTFPPPSVEDVSDAASAHLLWQAARLTLREGATPFRSLGRISIRPRVYQFVPLLMALRLDPVRLFIADDVGVGKTIEALLIARELWDRGEVRRFCVLCPPYLCDQWQSEITQKFNLDAVVIRSGTVRQLERHVPAGKSIYEWYPVQVISIDWVKSERNKHQFLQFCPELVIVDEAHGAAEASERSKAQQQRHQLLREVAADENRHLILLTATPHSGIEAAFRSLLGLLRREFGNWDIGHLGEQERIELARHFVQRTRKDIEQDWEGERCFPTRVASDETYQLSECYRKLFERTYLFCSEIIRTGQALEERKRRVRYWGALALLRCVMSSPAAAIAALEKRAARSEERPESELEVDWRGFVFESADERTDDESPTPLLEAAEATMSDTERRRLRELARLAEDLQNSEQDTKLHRCIEVVRNLLADGFHPIIWCRYVATAEYVGEALRRELPNVQVVTITGRMGDDERRIKIDEISTEKPRVLVATDCLSEGVNLQEKFTAVLHYDLPWNPNRLEQREGRVDRYGQTASTVKAVRFYGRDNPVDGVVIEVLLDKAREIHRALGIHVPVPEESESVLEAVLNALFLRSKDVPTQLGLFEEPRARVEALHQRWERDAERERINRTRFAQRALKPEEVKRELEATDAVLGDPDAVKDFVLNAAQRIGLTITRDNKRPDVYRIPLDSQAIAILPEAVRSALPLHSPFAIRHSPPYWLVSFVSPTPEGAEYLGRNHRFVAALAQYLFEAALEGHQDSPAKRCGAIATGRVECRTVLFLVRLRYLVTIPEKAPMLSEEVRVVGFRRTSGDQPGAVWERLTDEESMRLLSDAKPDANLALEEKKRLAQEALNLWPYREAGGAEFPLLRALEDAFLNRAIELEESHKRIRRSLRLRVKELKVDPQLPPDLLGVLVLEPWRQRP